MKNLKIRNIWLSDLSLSLTKGVLFEERQISFLHLYWGISCCGKEYKGVRQSLLLTEAKIVRSICKLYRSVYDNLSYFRAGITSWENLVSPIYPIENVLIL